MYFIALWVIWLIFRVKKRTNGTLVPKVLDTNRIAQLVSIKNHQLHKRETAFLQVQIKLARKAIVCSLSPHTLCVCVCEWTHSHYILDVRWKPWNCFDSTKYYIFLLQLIYGHRHSHTVANVLTWNRIHIYILSSIFFLSTISLSHSLTHTCMRAHMYGIECTTTVRIYEAKRHNREDVWVETKLNQRDEIKKPKICKRKKSISATYLTAHYLVLQCFFCPFGL